MPLGALKGRIRLIAERCLVHMDQSVLSTAVSSRCITSLPTGRSCKGQVPLQRRPERGSPGEWEKKAEQGVPIDSRCRERRVE